MVCKEPLSRIKSSIEEAFSRSKPCNVHQRDRVESNTISLNSIQFNLDGGWRPLRVETESCRKTLLKTETQFFETLSSVYVSNLILLALNCRGILQVSEGLRLLIFPCCAVQMHGVEVSRE